MHKSVILFGVNNFHTTKPGKYLQSPIQALDMMAFEKVKKLLRAG